MLPVVLSSSCLDASSSSSSSFSSSSAYSFWLESIARESERVPKEASLLLFSWKKEKVQIISPNAQMVNWQLLCNWPPWSLNCFSSFFSSFFFLLFLAGIQSYSLSAMRRQTVLGCSSYDCNLYHQTTGTAAAAAAPKNFHLRRSLVVTGGGRKWWWWWHYRI